jgi:2',3'-cyclic-nucleotide 2'-phosphodiesterase (5'-nucleotidase family)
MKRLSSILLLFFLIFFACSKDNTTNTGNGPDSIDPVISKELTLFFINDMHGQLDNFSKIKHIVDQERAETNVLLTSSGDIFSGNPVVDNFPEKGFPIIDIMNRTGFDVSVIGNHEYDYGESILTDRINQANFDWVCANVDMTNSTIPQPFEYTTLSIDNLRVTFLGLVETNGKDNGTIPSTHPWRVQNLIFEKPEDVLAQYSGVKDQENSDLFIALTHLGFEGFGGSISDSQIAMQYPFFDLILGGHSHQIINNSVNGIPIYQSGSNLNYLGKAELTIKDRSVESINYELINLNTYVGFDQDLKTVIDDYNNLPYLNEVIGFSHAFHEKSEVGCFYTDALRGVMNVDVTIQNNGGIRSDLNEGDITVREIFEISPFNNGTVIYNMTVGEIKDFLRGSHSGFYYSGVEINQIGSDIQIKDLSNNVLSDNTVLTLGTNDYIPAVYDNYFPVNGNVQTLTAAETIISYLENVNDQVSYPSCVKFFRYQ